MREFNDACLWLYDAETMEKFKGGLNNENSDGYMLFGDVFFQFLFAWSQERDSNLIRT